MAYVDDSSSLVEDDEDLLPYKHQHGTGWTAGTPIFTDARSRGLTGFEVAYDNTNNDLYVAYMVQETSATTKIVRMHISPTLLIQPDYHPGQVNTD